MNKKEVSDLATQLAAQIWTKSSTSNIEMDIRLAIEIAREFDRFLKIENQLKSLYDKVDYYACAGCIEAYRTDSEDGLGDLMDKIQEENGWND